MPSALQATRIAYIDGKIQYGRGKAASVLGQTYNVYRLLPTTSVSVLAQNPLYANWPARIRRTTDVKAIEDQIFKLLVFRATFNSLNFLVGDVMQETGYKAQAEGVYVFVQSRPTRESLWMRAESNCTISRPTPTAGQAAQLPASGALIARGYGGYVKDTEWPLTLTNGRYAFTDIPGMSPATIPVGIQQELRVADSREPKFPVTAYRERFLIFIPPTPGEEINEMDRVNAGNGDRYQIASILQTASVGVSGWICIAERLGV